MRFVIWQKPWTQAREQLDVVTVIFANRSYKILEGELERMDIQGIGPTARQLLDLTSPKIDWVRLANGMGVNAASVNTAEQFIRHLETAIDMSGPYLIEVVC